MGNVNIPFRGNIGKPKIPLNCKICGNTLPIDHSFTLETLFHFPFCRGEFSVTVSLQGVTVIPVTKCDAIIKNCPKSPASLSGLLRIFK